MKQKHRNHSSEDNASKKKTLDESYKESQGDEVSEISDVECFDVLSSKNSSIVNVIDNLLTVYTKDKQQGIRNIVNFVIRASGCTYTLTEEQYRRFEELEDGHEDFLLKRLGTDGDRGSYPISTKSHRFRDKFIEFWKKILVQCQREIIYDEYFLDTLIAFIVIISRSPVRSLRHTATLAALQIQSSLASIASTQYEQLAVSQRQVESEKRKRNKASKTKISGLVERSDALKSHIKILEGIMGELMEGLYEHRYRDINPQIRGDCVTALGNWILKYPSFFLTNNYLKKIGFALYDKSPEVRLSTVNALCEIYATLDSDLLSNLDKFNEKFKARMLQLIEDCNTAVAVAAIQLCSYLASYNVLKDEEINDIYALLSDYDGKIRQAAGDLIVDYLLNNEITVATERRINTITLKRSKEKELAISKLRAVFGIIQNYTSHSDLPDYAVDVLWPRLDVLRDWETLTELLISPPNDIDLSDSEIILLIKTLTACVKRASGKLIIPKSKGDPHNTDSSKVIEENTINMTSHLAKVLPDILKKYLSENEAILYLVQIPQYFVMDIYAEYGLEQYFIRLLELMKESFTKSVHWDVLKNIAATLKYFKSTDHKQQKDAEVAVVEIIEKAFKNFKRDARQLNTSISKSTSESISEDESHTLVSLSVNIRRLNSFHAIDDIEKILNNVNYCEILNGLLVVNQDMRLPDDVILPLMQATQYSLLWSMTKIDVNTTNRKQQQPLADQSQQFFAHLQRLLSDTSSPTVGESCFFMLSDLMLAFNRTLKTYKTILSGLAFNPSEELVNKLIDYFSEEMSSMEDTSNLNKYDNNPDEEHVPIFEQENSVCIRKSKFITALGKLIIYSAFPGSFNDYAPIILMHFLEHGKSVDSVIKAFLTLLRKYIKYDFEIIFHTLKRKYETFISDDNEKVENKYSILSRFSKRIAATYGIGTNRSNDVRVSIANLICTCIDWVLFDPVKTQDFLTFTVDAFITKLDTAAAQTVLNYFEERIRSKELSESDESLLQFFKFRDHLRDISKGNTNAKSQKAYNTRNQRRKLVPLHLTTVPLQNTELNQTTDSTNNNKQSKKRKKRDDTPPLDNEETSKARKVSNDKSPQDHQEKGKRQKQKSNEKRKRKDREPLDKAPQRKKIKDSVESESSVRDDSEDGKSDKVPPKRKKSEKEAQKDESEDGESDKAPQKRKKSEKETQRDESESDKAPPKRKKSEKETLRDESEDGESDKVTKRKKIQKDESKIPTRKTTLSKNIEKELQRKISKYNKGETSSIDENESKKKISKSKNNNEREDSDTENEPKVPPKRKKGTQSRIDKNKSKRIESNESEDGESDKVTPKRKKSEKETQKDESEDGESDKVTPKRKKSEKEPDSSVPQHEIQILKPQPRKIEIPSITNRESSQLKRNLSSSEEEDIEGETKKIKVSETPLLFNKAPKRKAESDENNQPLPKRPKSKDSDSESTDISKSSDSSSISSV